MMKKAAAFIAVLTLILTAGVSAAFAAELTFTDTTLPEAVANVEYRADLNDYVSGGTGPYTFSLESDPMFLPSGLVLDSNGSLHGTPTTGGSTYSSIVIRAQDSAGGSVTGTFRMSVHAKRVQFQIDENSFVYDAKPHKVAAHAFLDGRNIDEEIDFSITVGGAEEQTDVGNYNIVIRVSTPGLVIGSQDKTHMYITKLNDVSVEFENFSFPYDGAPHSPSVSVTGSLLKPNAYSLTYMGMDGTEYGPQSQPPSQVGMYRLECTVTDNNCMTPVNNSVLFEITRNDVDFTLSDMSPFFYGDVWDRTYTPSVPSVSDYTVKYIKQEDGHDSGEPLDAPKDIGTYRTVISLSESDAQLYRVGSVLPAYITVRERVVNFTVTDTVKTYSGTEQYPQISNDAGLDTGKYTVKYYADPDGLESVEPKNAGKYRIEITLSPGSGYTLGTVSPDLFEITKMPVDFTVTNTTAEYDKSEHTATVENNALLGTDKYTVKYTDKDGTKLDNAVNAGEYTIEITLTDDSGNYTLGTVSDTTYTITPKQTSFTMSDTMVKYDGQKHKAKAENADGLAEGVDFNITYTNQDDPSESLDGVTDAGRYDIHIEITNDNYTLDPDFSEVMTIESSAVLNAGNSPAALIMRNAPAEAETFRSTRKFSEYVPEGASKDTVYRVIDDLDLDGDVNTVIVNDISEFADIDPGMSVNGSKTPVKADNASQPARVSDGLYTVTYTYDGGTLQRYVLVPGTIGDVNADGAVNAVDANSITKELKSSEGEITPDTVTRARVWDVTKDGMITKDDADAVVNRFLTPLTAYYPWL